MDLGEVTLQSDLSITNLKKGIDEYAYALMPPDLPTSVNTHGRPSFPIIVNGDGNCLARVGSILAYSCETHHADIRLRLAAEMILYRDKYLDVNHLSQGLPAKQRLSPAMIAQFSDAYTGQILDDAGVKEIYEKEINQVAKMGEYMGTWQLFALASILKIPIFSAYPKLENVSVRKDLHRVIMPREMSNNAKFPVVMWSSCRDDMREEHWVPNHFCAILPVSTYR
jgi:hypothetical protein